jgi:hypothetical protein
METEGITLYGAKEVEAALKILGEKAAKRVLRSAAQAGATQLKKAIVAAAPKSTVNRKSVYGGHRYEYLKKHLRQQITTKIVKAFESDVKILIHTSDAFWGRFIEKGTKRGIDARHWMETAFDGAEENVKAGIEAKLVQAVMREADKGVG